MKRSFMFIGIILLGVIGLSSCNIFYEVEGSGIIETEYRRASYFNRIEVNLPAEVILRQGPAKDIEIEAESNIIPRIITRISGNTLILDNNGGWYTNKKIKIWIQTPDIYSIDVSSSGKVISDNKIYGKSIDLRLSGSGLIDVAIDMKNDVAADLSGSGLIFIEGDTHNAIYTMSGSGKIESFGLRVDNTDVDINGSGRCETTTYNNLDVYISGSGSVWFKGSPRISHRISGSGKIVDAN
ncbi:head GIN domain-containing protein [Emticicia sp. 17c]|uniref:head GIN domain-containing protein n=1 Tax=Emticicia sp. 17c TaxID=3127704 RepID=UPI00301B7752